MPLSVLRPLTLRMSLSILRDTSSVVSPLSKPNPSVHCRVERSAYATADVALLVLLVVPFGLGFRHIPSISLRVAMPGHLFLSSVVRASLCPGLRRDPSRARDLSPDAEWFRRGGLVTNSSPAPAPHPRLPVSMLCLYSRNLRVAASSTHFSSLHLGRSQFHSTILVPQGSSAGRTDAAGGGCQLGPGPGPLWMEWHKSADCARDAASGSSGTHRGIDMQRDGHERTDRFVRLRSFPSHTHTRMNRIIFNLHVRGFRSQRETAALESERGQQGRGGGQGRSEHGCEGVDCRRLHRLACSLASIAAPLPPAAPRDCRFYSGGYSCVLNGCAYF